MKRSVPPSAQGPWAPLNNLGSGYLSFYYSEPLARFPIREVTKPGDNKSDPNIETSTYGLFSTCEPQMRNRIVTDGAATVVFVTRLPKSGRAVSGYYKMSHQSLGERGLQSKDWALFATEIRFIEPIPIGRLSASVKELRTPFRTQRPLTPESTLVLQAAIEAKEDLTSLYLGELERIEKVARTRTGFSYPSWGRESSFEIDEAKAFLSAGTGSSPNSSPTRWVCSSCNHEIPNIALLRRCPVCHTVGSLSPKED